ncbi:putative LRR receptor-like serine/threonine-protein kinase [Hibiscus syriacus]|uniref:LRR receptor-like serine/threonine-protein kinase n=1 Tax=Hibiscus syriacus TaxID=106335 RepID=A0A6A3B8L5_HIBSY|nr:putative LRR receptor-like serine/threonine-protein kinase [Hibiscus syriacus]
MWRPWDNTKKPLPIHHTSSPFSCSSFKDIQRICTEDSSPPLSSPAAAKRSANVFHRVRLANSLFRSLAPDRTGPNGKTPDSVSVRPISIPGADKRIVVYSTSLLVVRSTFEDCKTVRSILQGFRVSIDERDLSMDSSFLKELRGILGQSKLSLPRVSSEGDTWAAQRRSNSCTRRGSSRSWWKDCPMLSPVLATFAAVIGSSCATNVTAAVDCTPKNLGSRLVRPVMKMVSSGALLALLYPSSTFFSL